MPQPKAAIPTPKIAAITSAALLLLAPAASPPCANAAGAKSATPVSAVNNILNVFMYCLLMNYRQEVVAGHRAAGLTLKRFITSTEVEANLCHSPTERD